MAKSTISDLVDEDEDGEGGFDVSTNEDQPLTAAAKYEIRRRIEELQEQKRLQRLLSDFDDYDYLQA